MAANVLSVSICVSVEEKLDYCILVVEFPKGTRYNWFLEAAFRESTKVPPCAGLVCLVEGLCLWLAAYEISAVRY
jgi:hypothetical protein